MINFKRFTSLIYPPWAGMVLLLFSPSTFKLKQIGLCWLFVLPFSFFASIILTSIFRALAHRYSVVDIPDRRKVHQRPRLLLGGVAVYLAFIISIVFNNIIDQQVVAILLAGIFVMMASLIDDVKRYSARSKLLVHVLAPGVIVASRTQVMFLPQNIWGVCINYFPTSSGWWE